MTKSEASATVEKEESVTFADLGLMKELCDACERLKFKNPTPIQRAAIPPALQGHDVIGLAQTGSGKTAAFVLPILQTLWDAPQPFFACVLAPTRELVFQISQQIEALGAAIGVRTAVIIGGVDMMAQAIALSKKPHIVVATPGRLQDHLENTKGFHLNQLKYLVLDEADRLLDLDFGPKIESILTALPDQRKTFLFSATMTDKVLKLQRASMKQKPVKVEVSSKYSTVQTLLQYYLFFPLKFKETYLVYLMNEFPGQSTLIFASTVLTTQKLAFMLKHLGFSAICIHGQMTQANRLNALAKFKAGQKSILVATDVVARGLDIPLVDLVVNYDVPDNSKTYIHRVGRTARAGRSGKSITFVTQYDVELYQRIETLIGKQLELYPTNKEEVMVLHERTQDATRVATHELKEMEKEKKQMKRSNGTKKRKFGGPNLKENQEEAGVLLSDCFGKSKDKYANFKSTKKRKH